MFTINTLQDADLIVIARDQNLQESIRLQGLTELLQLRQRINQYIDDLQPDRILDPESPLVAILYIDTVEAVKRAADAGISLPPTTIRAAIANGNIPGGGKRGGRYVVPAHTFDDWLDHYSSNKPSSRD